MAKSTYYFELNKIDAITERNKELSITIKEIFIQNKGRYGVRMVYKDLLNRGSAGTLRSESEIRGTLRFLPQLEMRPSSNAPNPVESREAPPTSYLYCFLEDLHLSTMFALF